MAQMESGGVVSVKFSKKYGRRFSGLAEKKIRDGVQGKGRSPFPALD